MIWAVLAVIIVSIAVVNSMRSKPISHPTGITPKSGSKAQRIKAIIASIEDLQDTLNTKYVNEIELSVEEIKKENGKEKILVQPHIDFVQRRKDNLDDFRKFVVLNARLAETLYYKQDELLEQLTDWFRVLEYYDYVQTLHMSAHSYQEHGVDAPEPSEIHEARAIEIIKRINVRAKQNKLL